MNKKYFIITILIIFFIGLAIGYYLYTKKAQIKSTGAPDFEKDITAWVKELNTDTSASLTFSAFIGKSVKLDAEVIDIKGDSSKTLQLKTGIEDFFVNANFHQSIAPEISGVVIGDRVIVQCVCDGLALPESADDLFSEKIIQLSRCNLLQLTKKETDVSESHEHQIPSNK